MKKNNQQLIFGIHACVAALTNSKRVINKIICTEQVFNKYKNLIEKKNIKDVFIKKKPYRFCTWFNYPSRNCNLL